MLASFTRIAAVMLVATSTAAAPLRHPLPLRNAVQDKNFFVLTFLQRHPPNDPDLRRLAEEKRAALHRAAAECEKDIACYAAAMRLSEGDIKLASEGLRRAHVDAEDLRRSGTYIRFDGPDLVVDAWADAAHGINDIIDVYGLGKPPHYAAIDSVSFDVKSDEFVQLIRVMTAVLDEQRDDMHLFFEPSLQFALHLLAINGRDEAGRFEPMEKTVNAAVRQRIPKIAWDRYPYTVILLPGFGPEQTQWHLSAEGWLRVELAARRYHEGKAPLIVVSGGYVHPKQTPYCEAIEMKRALIDDFGVPANAIVVEPHARHTTTNVRNTVRLLYRYGIPFTRKALITTDQFHSAYVGSDAFSQRFTQELGYQPATIGRRISPFDVEFTPSMNSLQIDPRDPLDP